MITILFIIGCIILIASTTMYIIDAIEERRNYLLDKRMNDNLREYISQVKKDLDNFNNEE